MNKVKVFEKELKCINNKNIREFTEKAISKLPDYFFVIPASSSGKHHPAYALEEGGLVKHTKATIGIATDLFRVSSFDNAFNSDEKDIIITSLLLHDGLKSGKVKQKYTVAEHPLLVADMLEEDNEINSCVDEEILSKITKNIRSHMGQWNKDYKTKKEILPKPKGVMANFVHLCDYLASRKRIEVNFDVEY